MARHLECSAEVDAGLGDSGFSISPRPATLFKLCPFFPPTGSLAYIVLTYNPKRKESIFPGSLGMKVQS